MFLSIPYLIMTFAFSNKHYEKVFDERLTCLKCVNKSNYKQKRLTAILRRRCHMSWTLLKLIFAYLIQVHMIEQQ